LLELLIVKLAMFIVAFAPASVEVSGWLSGRYVKPDAVCPNREVPSVTSSRVFTQRTFETTRFQPVGVVPSSHRLYQAKTGEPVSILIPKKVVAALHKLPSKSDWFFWTGQSRTTTVTGFWRARIAKVFKLAKLENAHPHRFRDTFAVSLLNAGASLENVSVLLGHTSIRVTQKHYNPWVKSRQDALDLAVKKALRS